MNQIPTSKDTKGRSASDAKLQVPCDPALREQGIDESFIAQRLLSMFEAKGKRWNPATASWETFEDYRTQLKAIREAVKLLGLYPTQKDLEARHRPHQIQIRVVHVNPPRKADQYAKRSNEGSTSGMEIKTN